MTKSAIKSKTFGSLVGFVILAFRNKIRFICTRGVSESEPAILAGHLTFPNTFFSKGSIDLFLEDPHLSNADAIPVIFFSTACLSSQVRGNTRSTCAVWLLPSGLLPSPVSWLWPLLASSPGHTP